MGVANKMERIEELEKRIKQIKDDNKGKDLDRIYYGGITANEYIESLRTMLDSIQRKNHTQEIERRNK